MFNITEHKGFQIKFDNGITASVQWGPGNYCDHHGAVTLESLKVPAKSNSWKSSTAEVAAFIEGGDFVAVKGFTGVEETGDDVAGRLNPAQVLEFLNAVASM
jgi:hypothetical protein